MLKRKKYLLISILIGIIVSVILPISLFILHLRSFFDHLSSEPFLGSIIVGAFGIFVFITAAPIMIAMFVLFVVFGPSLLEKIFSKKTTKIDDKVVGELGKRLLLVIIGVILGVVSGIAFSYLFLETMFPLGDSRLSAFFCAFIGAILGTIISLLIGSKKGNKSS